VCTGPDWVKGESNGYVDTTPPDVLNDISNCALSQVSWITPAGQYSDHPINSGQGPSWVAAIVNAIGSNANCDDGTGYWKDTVIFITWDDWGGWYDHVPPQEIDNMGPGFRVPLIVVSPYAKRGYVSHQVYETASLLTYMEKNYGLPNLGTRDANANDLSDCFDYSQTPAKYAPIPTGVTVDRLLHEKSSGPPDDD
jgi:phospholipase C